MTADDIKRAKLAIDRYGALMRATRQGFTLNIEGGFVRGSDALDLPRETRTLTRHVVERLLAEELAAVRRELAALNVDESSIAIRVPGTVYGPEGRENWNVTKDGAERECEAECEAERECECAECECEAWEACPNGPTTGRTPPAEWIDVSTPPDIDREVLVTDGTRVEKARLHGVWWFNGARPLKPTHWMPLPAI